MKKLLLLSLLLTVACAQKTSITATTKSGENIKLKPIKTAKK